MQLSSCRGASWRLLSTLQLTWTGMQIKERKLFY